VTTRESGSAAGTGDAPPSRSNPLVALAHYHGTIHVMGLPQSKVTAQGQISVPAEIRRKLGIGPGSVLEWDQEGEKVVVRKAGRYSSEDIHRAVFTEPPRPRTVEEMKEAVRRAMGDRHARR
jgi:antitoxin PrlF